MGSGILGQLRREQLSIKIYVRQVYAITKENLPWSHVICSCANHWAEAIIKGPCIECKCLCYGGSSRTQEAVLGHLIFEHGNSKHGAIFKLNLSKKTN